MALKNRDLKAAQTREKLEVEEADMAAHLRAQRESSCLVSPRFF